jgi:hypothetical protein
MPMRFRRNSYPWHAMRVGNTITARPNHKPASFRALASNQAKKLHFTIMVYQTPDGLTAQRLA